MQAKDASEGVGSWRSKDANLSAPSIVAGVGLALAMSRHGIGIWPREKETLCRFLAPPPAPSIQSERAITEFSLEGLPYPRRWVVALSL